MNKEEENQFKENIKEIARLELKNSFNNNLMETLNSAFIFKYVDTLEKENKQLKEQVDRYKRLIEYLKKLDFYEFDLDYDYEENPIDNYYPADMEYHINNWLANEELE